jgi:hypothetical protein
MPLAKPIAIAAVIRRGRTAGRALDLAHAVDGEDCVDGDHAVPFMKLILPCY